MTTLELIAHDTLDHIQNHTPFTLEWSNTDEQTVRINAGLQARASGTNGPWRRYSTKVVQDGTQMVARHFCEISATFESDRMILSRLLVNTLDPQYSLPGCLELHYADPEYLDRATGYLLATPDLHK